MNFLDVKNTILGASLPGISAQKELAPFDRVEYTYEEIKEKKAQQASVLITLYQKSGGVYFPLILRSEYEGFHSGQIALPGGKKEAYDQTYEETALRETYEEIGLNKKTLHIIKKLSPLYISISNFYIHPFIAFYENGLVQFQSSPNEVQKIIEIELEQFLFGTKIVNKQISDVYFQEVPAFQYGSITIWGATAMILNEFKHLFK